MADFGIFWLENIRKMGRMGLRRLARYGKILAWQTGHERNLPRNNAMNTETWALEVNGVYMIARAPHGEWKEIFQIIREEYPKYRANRISDYTGDAIEGEHVLYYAGGCEDYPHHVEKWLVR